MEANRELDITVFGATGFVGRLVASYLAEHTPDGVRVGLAGRSREKLARVRAELPARARDWPLVVANSGDGESLAAMARGTRVVATTVGPYRREGLRLVEACADTGTDYADLTGEVLFVRESIERDARAAATGARIVHSCGFDAIPSDLGVYSLHERAQADGAGDLEETTLVITAMRGGFSGGSFATVKGMVDEIKSDREARRRAADPYALVPDGTPGRDTRSERDSFGVGRDGQLGQWVAPSPFGSSNARIVRRSNALQDYAYGRGFRYREVMGVGSGPLAPLKGAAIAGGLVALAGGLAFDPTRKLLDRVLPSPGEGPSEEARRKGYFRVEIHARTSSGARYLAVVAAKSDPGYAATAMMMGEAALCLALDRDRLPQRAGILTPASAMDGALIERLRAAGMMLDVERCASFESESDPSVAVYTPTFLAVYDTLVLGLNCRFVWRWPKSRGLEFYNRHVGARHLDIGVGTGYFLDRCRFPVADPQITLLDLSAPCLAHAARRLARYSPETRRASVLDETLDLGEARFDSIALAGVLHCLPATMDQKVAALARLRRYLADDGVLFGVTILGRGVRHNRLARRVIADYNRKGIFTNLDDDLEGLEQGLAAGFADVDVHTEGSFTVFTARPSSALAQRA